MYILYLCLKRPKASEGSILGTVYVSEKVAVSGQAASQSVVSIFSLLVLEPYYLSSAAAGDVDLSNPPSLSVSQRTAAHTFTSAQLRRP